MNVNEEYASNGREESAILERRVVLEERDVALRKSISSFVACALRPSQKIQKKKVAKENGSE